MIPADELIAGCLIVLPAPFDKGGERIGIGHRFGSEIVFFEFDSAGFDLVNLVCGIADDGILPLRASAGIDEEIHIVGNRSLGHFRKVGSRHAGF